MLLIAYDISSQFDLGPFLLFLQQRGFTVERQETMLQDYSSDEALLQRIKEKQARHQCRDFPAAGSVDAADRRGFRVHPKTSRHRP